MIGQCAAENARASLAAGRFSNDIERGVLEHDAKGCLDEQADPWDPALKWKRCPAQEAFRHPDIADALFVKRLMNVQPIANWPRGIVARVAETLVEMEAARG